jgi:hypothetical protein
MGNVFVDPDDDELTLHRSADPGKLCPGGSQPAWMSREMKANDELEKARHLKVVP